MPVPLTLKVFKGGTLVSSKDFERDIIKIGRLASAHLCLEDDKVSRIHSVIEVASDGSLSIIDMGSVEGTYVNGKRVNKGQLSFGDEIKVGGTTIRLEDTTAIAAANLSVAASSTAPVPTPTPVPATTPAPATSGAPIVEPIIRMSLNWTLSPASAASFSTRSTSPAWTRYCLPPVLRTANIRRSFFCRALWHLAVSWAVGPPRTAHPHWVSLKGIAGQGQRPCRSGPYGRS